LQIVACGSGVHGDRGAGYLAPFAGAILQEIVDVAAVVNALRVALPPKTLTDY